MAINSKITLGWNGKEYKIKMTQDVIIQVEELGIYEVNRTIEAGKIPSFMRISIYVSFLLNEAGASTTVKEVNEAIFGQGDTSPDDVIALHGAIMTGIVAEPKKKPTTHSPKAKVKKKTKKK